MITVTRFKLYPNKELEDRLFSNLHICSFVYNWCLDHNIWNDSVLPRLKEVYPDVREVHSKVLQNVVEQLRDNISNLSEKKKKGQKVGRLRHKPRHSMIYEQSGFRIDEELNLLRLSKIGAIPIVLSRPIDGEIKQIIIKHNKTHNWFASVVSETNKIDDWFEFRKTYTKPMKIKAVGIDLNVLDFSTDSDGLVVKHPKNIKKVEKRLRREQKKLSRRVKGSNNRKKQKKQVARVHERTENRREDFLHKLSRYYVDNYDLIALEDLNIAGMVHWNSGMAKAILDASWGKFANYVSYKADNAGKYAVFVIAKGTTQDCSACGKAVPKDLSVRVHSCPYCGSVMPRDYNSSREIKFRGIEKVGWGTPEPNLLDMRKLNTLAEIKTSILDIYDPKQVFIAEPRISRL